MCGRITQLRRLADYAAGMGWPAAVAQGLPGTPLSQYNGAPGAEHWTMHCLDGQPALMCMRWGYRPRWAAEKGLSMAINARIERAGSGAYFRGHWKAGRILVPADGWYEWTGEPGSKQPWYIHLADGGPMYLAALASYRPDKPLGEDGGFVIVTAAAERGLLDRHDRRPVVLAPEDAALWLDTGFSAEQAEQLARAVALPPEAFAWHPVSTAVNRVGRSEERMIAPMADPVDDLRNDPHDAMGDDPGDGPNGAPEDAPPLAPLSPRTRRPASARLR